MCSSNEIVPELHHYINSQFHREAIYPILSNPIKCITFWHFVYRLIKINTGVQSINNVYAIVNKVENVLVNTYIFDFIDNGVYVVYALYSRTLGHSQSASNLVETMLWIITMAYAYSVLCAVNFYECL
jgi:hypothetical protein